MEYKRFCNDINKTVKPVQQVCFGDSLEPEDGGSQMQSKDQRYKIQNASTDHRKMGIDTLDLQDYFQ